MRSIHFLRIPIFVGGVLISTGIYYTTDMHGDTTLREHIGDTLFEFTQEIIQFYSRSIYYTVNPDRLANQIW